MPTPVPMINSTEDNISRYNQQAKLGLQEPHNIQPQPQLQLEPQNTNFNKIPSPDDALSRRQITRKDSQASFDGSSLNSAKKEPDLIANNGYQPYQTTSSVTLLETLPDMMSKANLIFEGEPIDMTLDWSEEEINCRRRLVQFWRRHDNSDIYCTFRPMVPGTRPGNNIVVSCIFWDERNEWFITSVDCIHLLESLISVRFTVEEKNRIRRNLEGFRPLTVSKCKSETAEFFKLIMAFPNPKPRNIEKDVKVFPWRVLTYALKKIVNKYATGFAPSINQQSTKVNNQTVLPRQHSIPNQLPTINQQRTFNAYSPYPQNPEYAFRANYHRRYSQPTNMLMGMYNQPVIKHEMGGPEQNQHLFSRPGQGVSNFIPGPSYSIGQLMPAISEKPNFGDYNNSQQYGQLQQDNAQRRHSLADPYSFQRTQYRISHNLQPLIKLEEETGNSVQYPPPSQQRPNYSQPSGLALIDESQLNSFKNVGSNDHEFKSSQANIP